jgi:hypothetical protein
VDEVEICGQHHIPGLGAGVVFALCSSWCVCWESTSRNDQEEVMTETAPNGKTILRSSRTSLTKDQIFRLWKAAIKDDDKFVDAVIQKVHGDMLAFDNERGEIVIDLMVRRHMIAGDEFRTLLSEMQEVSGATLRPPLAAPPAQQGFYL